jgi:type I restriction enzyme S subunit
MTADLRPYPEYKESGLPWLGRIPAHWKIGRNGRLFEQRNQNGFSDLPILEVSLRTGVRVRNMDNLKRKQVMSDCEKYKRAVKGDIAYNMMRMWQGAVGVAPVDGLVSPAYVVARPYSATEPRYFAYLFRTKAYMNEVDGYSRGIVKDRNRLYWQDFKRMPSCIPPYEEQKAIANYLDANAIKIRRFIRNRRRLIEVLNEQKQAIINRAVTRGLDPNAKLKPSGVEWIGDIPQNWKTRRIKTFSKILRGKFSHRPRNDPSLYDGDFPFIQTGDVARANKYIIGYKQSLNERGYAISKEFPKGTLIMTIAANIGDVAILDFAACFPDSIVGFVPNEEIFLEFLFYLFTAMKMEFLKEAPVNTQGNLNVERIGSMFVAIPDLETQRSLVAAIKSKTHTIDQAISHSQREIELVCEYRTCMITEVVTGKIDVRHLSPDLVEQVDELSDFEEEMDIENLMMGEEPEEQSEMDDFDME